MTVQVPRRDGRPGRQAIWAVRYGAFALRPPSTHPRRQELPTPPLRTVLVEEGNAPAGVQPLQWLLLTTPPINGIADAERLVRWYTYRWRIERYPFTLKSGCRLEELQLETAERLRRALALYAMAAARLLHLTYLARREPEAPCEPAVSAEEWEVLWRQFRPGEGLRRNRRRCGKRYGGSVGWGIPGRKGDGEPGVKALWRGLRQLQAMVIGFRLAKVYKVPTNHKSRAWERGVRRRRAGGGITSRFSAPIPARPRRGRARPGPAFSHRPGRLWSL